MAYIKIVLALLIWGLLFFYGGSTWLDNKREQTCTSEIEKDNPNLQIVHDRCLQTAEVYMKNEDYGSAAWFYLLAGEYEKNIDEVEAKITDDFYMNIGHSYLLTGNYEKAKEIYSNYPWEGGEDFHYSDEGMQHDFVILPKLYKNKKENLEKGLAIWNEIYEPIGKIVKASNAYSMAEDDGDTKKQIESLKEYIKYAKPYKDKTSIDYIAKKKELAELYYNESLEKESIAIFKELASFYETNSSYTFDYIDTILTIAHSYSYLSDYNSSLEYHKKALALTLDSNDSDEQPLDVNIIYSNIADVYREMNKPKEARDYYTKALKYVESHDAKNYGRLSQIYSDIAEAYFGQKDYNASIENYGKAISFKKDELKDSEDYYREYIFSDLQELYAELSDMYKALNMKKEARETKEKYISFLEYEYENHYKHIAMAYDTMAMGEDDANISLNAELMAIKYIKKSVETEWGAGQVESNKRFYEYMNRLKECLLELDSNESKSAKAYLPYVESFKDFQSKVFGGENNNTLLLAKSYGFESQAYFDASDINRSKIYAQKAVEFMKESIKKSIDSEDDFTGYYMLDRYYLYLLNISYKSKSDIKPLIDDYLSFKKSYYKDGSEESISVYENIAGFFLNHDLRDSAVEYYKKALNEAIENNKNTTGNYLIGRNINNLKRIYSNTNVFNTKESIELINNLIDWQEKNYDNKYFLGSTHSALGDIYRENNETAMLEEEYNKSIELFKSYNTQKSSNEDSAIYDLIYLYRKLSTYYIEHGKKDEAIALMQGFITYVEKESSNNLEALSMSYNLFADIYELLNDEKKSKEYRDKASNLI